MRTRRTGRSSSDTTRGTCSELEVAVHLVSLASSSFLSISFPSLCTPRCRLAHETSNMDIEPPSIDLCSESAPRAARLSCACEGLERCMLLWKRSAKALSTGLCSLLSSRSCRVRC